MSLSFLIISRLLRYPFCEKSDIWADIPKTNSVENLTHWPQSGTSKFYIYFRIAGKHSIFDF